MTLFAGFGRRHVLFALAFSLVSQLAHVAYVAMGKEPLQIVPVAAWTVMAFLLALIGLACAVATDNKLAATTGTGVRLTIAVLAAAAVTTLAVELVLTLLPPPVVTEILGDKHRFGFLSAFHRIAYRFTAASGWSVLLIALYTMLQASRRATEQLHATRLRALAAERTVLESDLRAMQARVEPDLLFSALVAVDQAYAQSVRAGEEALDALIAFLRAALPVEASGTSTVAAELDLVRAYVGVVELLSAPRPKLEIAAEPAACAQVMPAMLLLPLVRWALEGAPSAALTMDARVRERTLEVTVRSDGAQAGVVHDLSGVRERIAQLFAGRGSLVANLDASGRAARLEIPVAA